MELQTFNPTEKTPGREQTGGTGGTQKEKDKLTKRDTEI